MFTEKAFSRMAENYEQLKNDRPLEVPSLLELSAKILANNAENLLNNFGRNFPGFPSQQQQRLRRDQAAEQALIHHQKSITRKSFSMCITRKKQQQQQPQQSCCCYQGLLPVRASEKVLQKLCENWRGRDMNPGELDAVLALFYNGQLCPVANANISNMRITDRMLAAFLVGQRKTLTSLSLINCTKEMSAAILCTLLQTSRIKLMNLRSLKLNSLYILRIPRELHRHNHPPQFVHFCPELEHLYLLQGRAHNIEEDDETKHEFLVRILSALPKLKTLDLSKWTLQNLSPLQKLQSLTSLVLYDVRDLEPCIFTIAALETLRHLDISQSDRSHGQYAQPVSSLHKLVCSLKNLQSLDISGTNLTDNPSENDNPYNEGTTAKIDSDIPGLCCLELPLKFLGIFNCEGTSAEWKNIPAEKVSGDHSEDQLLTALEIYLERPRTLQAVLYQIFFLYTDGSDLHRHREALHLVLRALEMHLCDRKVQIAGIASMFFIIRKVQMNFNTDRRLIQALIDGMQNHLASSEMVRNCCSCLCQFDLPHDVQFAYGRLANLLANVLETHNLDAFIPRKVVSLLDDMVFQVEGEQRIEVGETGAIEMILQQISRKLEANTCDEVLEYGWSFLWRVSYEIPANCERFLNAQGLALFNQCCTKFGDENPELLVENMLGVMVNIAENHQLRDQLMTNECVEAFCKLLANLDEGILVSYLSAGVLANLISDERWANKPGVDLSVDHVSMLIVQATENWDLQTRLCITYDFLKPIFLLLPLWHVTGSQHWAVWVLANITTAATDEKKQRYCRLIIEDGGMELLEQLKTDSRSTDGIRQLADIVIENVEDWKNNSPGNE